MKRFGSDCHGTVQTLEAALDSTARTCWRTLYVHDSTLHILSADKGVLQPSKTSSIIDPEVRKRAKSGSLDRVAEDEPHFLYESPPKRLHKKSIARCMWKTYLQTNAEEQ